MHWHKERDGRGYWCVTKYEDLKLVSRNPLLFSSWRGGTTADAGVYVFVPYSSAVKDMGSEAGAIVFTISLPMLAELVRERHADQQAVSRLAAVAAIGIVVGTDSEIVDRDL